MHEMCVEGVAQGLQLFLSEVELQSHFLANDTKFNPHYFVSLSPYNDEHCPKEGTEKEIHAGNVTREIARDGAITAL